jgi:hypothetical protein
MTLFPTQLIESTINKKFATYSLPYLFDKRKILTGVDTDYKTSIFSYYDAFDQFIYNSIFLSIIIIGLFTIIFRNKLLIMNKPDGVKLIFDVYYYLYALNLNQGIL